jgi:integrase
LRPSGVIYRLAKKPDPWLPPDWASAGTTRINRCSSGPFCTRWFLQKFRHPYAIRHLQDGIDIRTLQTWMGHRDIASTMVYLGGRNSDIQSRLKPGSIAAFG